MSRSFCTLKYFRRKLFEFDNKITEISKMLNALITKISKLNIQSPNPNS